MRTVRFFFCLFLSVSFLSVCSPAWAEDTGHLRLQIQAPPDFNTSIMINLIQDDVNTLLVAEPINQYKITQDVPSGAYQVDFVAADPYTVTYPKSVTVQAGQTAVLPLRISVPTQHQTAATTSISGEGAVPAEVPKKDSVPGAHPGHASSKAKDKSGQELAWALIRQCGASCLILLAGGIGYLLIIKKRKEEQ